MRKKAISKTLNLEPKLRTIQIRKKQFKPINNSFRWTVTGVSISENSDFDMPKEVINVNKT